MLVSLIVSALVIHHKPRIKRVRVGEPLSLIPSPQRTIRLKGSFRIGRNTQITCDDSSPEDRFAAEQLMEEVLTDLGTRIEPKTHAVKRGITLRRLTSEVSKADFGQGYVLEVTPLRVTVSAATSTGIFYGVQTLKQLIRANRKLNSIPACRITDFPTLKYRGWQHDISRGPIPTYAFLMKEIRTLSEFKLNLLTLYTEHVFKLKKHADIAPADGISAVEMAELSSYAHQYHVELVGNFQSFGHFQNILKLPEYMSLGENSSVLSPAKEESYRFLKDVFSEVAPAYSSKLFNINCDEVSGLGDGPSQELVKELGVGGVYARHINRVVELLHAYDKTPMMWGDIALDYPDIVPKLPKDLIVLPWGYDARSNFDNQIRPFTKFGLQFMVCPGVSCWNQIWPNLDNATVNISNFIRDGAKSGALGSLNTAWDDDGTNFFNDNWFEFAWGAECSWNPATPKRERSPDLVRKQRFTRFSKEFSSVFYGLTEVDVSAAFQQLSELRTDPISGDLRSGAVWRDPMNTTAKLPATVDIPRYLGKVSLILDSLNLAKSKATHNAPSLDYALFATREAGFLGESILAFQNLQNGDSAKWRNLPKRVDELRDAYGELWQRENRPWWLDKNIAKFDDLSKRIQKL